MAFSENLQFLRARRGTTQEQLAEELGVSRQSVSKWESGVSFPEMDTILRICDLYDVSMDILLRGSVEDSIMADTTRYDTFMTRFAKRVSFSVGAIIAAVAVMILIDAAGGSEVLGTVFLLLVAAVAVVILVASCIQHDQFRKKHPVIADFYTEQEKDAFHQKFIWFIAGGVGAILFGVALLVLASFLLGESEPYDSITTAAFLLIVAGAVTSLIYGGMQEEKYKIWKYNRDNNPTPEAKKRLALTGAACGCVMLLATAAFLWLGFTSDAWRTSWWVFPVGGVLCGVVSVILDPYKGDDD